ncbi:hypothetical protein CT694_06075 [Bacillus wiedmannii bv. thuringiensis]|nr:hypothetical protein CT694_06075 [Bacillus wiedmannii bv. thuringiensis]
MLIAIVQRYTKLYQRFFEYIGVTQNISAIFKIYRFVDKNQQYQSTPTIQSKNKTINKYISKLLYYK